MLLMELNYEKAFKELMETLVSQYLLKKGFSIGDFIGIEVKELTDSNYKIIIQFQEDLQIINGFAELLKDIVC